MDVRLTPELERLLDDEVSSGHYTSATEVIREGLKLLAEDRRWRDGVRVKIAEGLAQAASGDLVEGDAAIARLRARIEEQRRKRA